MKELYTVEQALKKKYGFHNNQPYDPKRCVATVSSGMVGFYQCSKKNGYGAHGLYCKTHAVYEVGIVEDKIKLFKATGNTVVTVMAHRITDKRYYFWKQIRDEYVIEDFAELNGSRFDRSKIFRVERDAIKHVIADIDNGIEHYKRLIAEDDKAKDLLIKRL